MRLRRWQRNATAIIGSSYSEAVRKFIFQQEDFYTQDNITWNYLSSFSYEMVIHIISLPLTPTSYPASLLAKPEKPALPVENRRAVWPVAGVKYDGNSLDTLCFGR